MIGRTDGDSVDALAHLLEHLAVIDELFGLGVQLGCPPEGLLIDVADGHDIAIPGRLGRVAASLAADADAGEVDLIERGSALRVRGGGADDPVADASQRRRFEEIPTIVVVAHGIKLLPKVRLLPPRCRGTTTPGVAPGSHFPVDRHETWKQALVV